MEAKLAKRIARLERSLAMELKIQAGALAEDATFRAEHGDERADARLKFLASQVKAARTWLAKALALRPEGAA